MPITKTPFYSRGERFKKPFLITIITDVQGVFTLKMHILQPKHTKLKESEKQALLDELNASLSQLPKISIEDKALPEDCQIGDIIKITRKTGGEETYYYRVVV